MVNICFENPLNDLNVSLIARTCDYFGVPFYITNPARLSHKLSAGTTMHKSPKVIKIKDWVGRVIVTDSSYLKSPKDIKFEDSDLIVFGNERVGISVAAISMASEFIGFRRKGLVNCLNVGMAVSAFLGAVY